MSYSLVSRSDRVGKGFDSSIRIEWPHTHIRFVCSDKRVLTMTVSTLLTESVGHPLCQEGADYPIDSQHPLDRAFVLSVRYGHRGTA